MAKKYKYKIRRQKMTCGRCGCTWENRQYRTGPHYGPCAKCRKAK